MCRKMIYLVSFVFVLGLFSSVAQGGAVTELDALPSGDDVVLVSDGPNQQNAAMERNPGADNPTHHDYKKSGVTIEDAALDGDEVNMTSITLLFNQVKSSGATTVTIPDEAGHVMQFWFGQIDAGNVPQLGGVTNTIDVRGVTFTAGKYYRFTLDTPVTFDASATNNWAWQGWWTTDDIDNDLVWARTNNNDVFAGGMLYQRDKTSTNTTFPFTDSTAAAGHDQIFAMEIAGIPQPYAWYPYPKDERTYNYISVVLSWQPGSYAAEHDVYFGTDFDDVNDASSSDPCGPDKVYKIRQSETQYPVCVGAPPCPEIPLEAGQTYYWRIDEVNDACAPNLWKGSVWSFEVLQAEAHNPSPAGGAKYVLTDTDLSWTAGLNASWHLVYFGTDYNDVNDANDSSSEYQGFTTAPDTIWGDGETLTPAPVKDTTYYWRIDEKEVDETIHKGAVWSFTTIPTISITDPNLMGWWKFDEGEGTTAMDRSGHDNHGTLMGDPNWAAGKIDGALDLDGNPDYVDITGYQGILGANPFSITAWINTSDSGGEIMGWGSTAGGATRVEFRIDSDRLRCESAGNVQGDTSLPNDEWLHVAVTVKAGATISYPDVKLYLNGIDDTRPSTDESALGMVAGHSVKIGRRHSGSDRWLDAIFDDVRIYDKELSQSEIRTIIGIDLAKAWNPRPDDGATDVPTTPILMWNPGDYAPGTNGHKVYFGADDSANMVLVSTPAQPQTPNEYDPGVLDLGRTYYWAVDEVNGAAPNGVDAGNTWSFTVIESLVVDDMESYGDGNTPGPGGAIFFVWRDGWTLLEGDGFPAGFLSNGTGASIGHWNTPYAETTIVSGGAQSMPYFYDNDGEVHGGNNPANPANPDNPQEHYSKAEAEISDLPSGIDPNWLTGGAKALSLQFHGDMDNDVEPMWVELTDTTSGKAAVKYGPPHLGEDVNDVNEESWHEWNIDLQDFADGGVDLTDVNSIAIIIGDLADDPNGSGTVYFDDIRLYAARCFLEKRDPNFAKFDYAPTGPGGDCVIDAEELDVMFGDWLDSDSTAYETAPPDDANLVGHWEFEGDFNDSSGSGYDGDPNGATTVYDADRGSDVLSLDGVGDYVDIPPGVWSSIEKQVTIAFWAYGDPDILPANTVIFGAFVDPNDKASRVALSNLPFGTGNVVFDTGGTYPASGYDRLSKAATPEEYEGSWQHWTFTKNSDTGEQKIYLNGVLWDSGTGMTRTMTGVTAFTIGCGAPDARNFYPGWMDDFRLYDKALSQGEILGILGIAEIYNELTSVANIYKEGKDNEIVNFKDYALLAERWLDEGLWP